MDYQELLMRLFILIGICGCVTPARQTSNKTTNLFEPTKTSKPRSDMMGFMSDPVLRSNYSPLRLSTETCRENQSYILKQTPQNQIEFGIYQSFSLSKLSFYRGGFFAGYRCMPEYQ